jgi:hypothetical protein
LDTRAYGVIADHIKRGNLQAAIKHLEQRAWPADRGAAGDGRFTFITGRTCALST